MATYPPLFRGTQASGTTIFVPVHIVAGCIGVHISWLDATSAATINLELTSYAADEAASDAAASDVLWPDSGETITGPVGAAAGSALINLSNVRQQRARLRIVASANCSWSIWRGVQSV